MAFFSLPVHVQVYEMTKATPDVHEIRLSKIIITSKHSYTSIYNDRDNLC